MNDLSALGIELPTQINSARPAPGRPATDDRFLDALLYAQSVGISPSEAVSLMRDNGFDPETAKGRGNRFVRLFKR